MEIFIILKQKKDRRLSFKKKMSDDITFYISGQMDINCIVFTCNDHEVKVDEGLKNIVENTQRKTVDAFQLLMGGGGG